ncbi:MAG: hypothetical protein QM764_15700 [Chitinophagaceae bacterium]
MKKIFFLFVICSIVCLSCSKSRDTQADGSTFEATINGKKMVFKVISATLLRSTFLNEKEFDIIGRASDSTELGLTIGEETSQGNGLTTKTYVLNPFPKDDPNTSVDESLQYIDGFTTYTQYINNIWLTDVYDEKGAFHLTSCDANNHTISGTFESTLTGRSTGTATVVITGGKINNIKYQVLN